MKKFNLIPIFLCKSSWDFDRMNECDEILNNWKKMFQASDKKGRHFLDLLTMIYNLCIPKEDHG